jgi:GNAT superfamily N-acetyltransferase
MVAVDNQNSARGAVSVGPVTTDVVLPLRHAVLRTGRPWSDAFYPADEDPLTAHFAAIEDSPGGRQVLCVGSILPEAPSWQATFDGSAGSDIGGFAWRVRGMATRADARSRGLGSQVLTGLLDHARSETESDPDGLIWFTARVPAIAFYERHGFTGRGEVDLAHPLGPHLTMWRRVRPDLPRGH